MDLDGDLETLLAEQHREFAAALAAESDHDFAYNLQLEEAMRLSLASQSSSSNQQFRFDLPNDTVSDTCVSLRLADDEIERFKLEQRDREQVEAEMKRQRDDLARRMHDLAFARDLLAVPEDQWMDTGNDIHHPYSNGDGNGDGSMAINDANFKVQCKGLVSEEVVGGVRTVVGGIGVAIFGWSAEIPVFEMKKGLDADEMTGNVAVDRGVAELRAVIEGLNAADALGLKSLTIFCDDSAVYQCVSCLYLLMCWLCARYVLGFNF